MALDVDDLRAALVRRAVHRRGAPQGQALVGVTDVPIHLRGIRPEVDSFALTMRVTLRNGVRP